MLISSNHVLTWLLICVFSSAWQQWIYETHWDADPNLASSSRATWEGIWGPNPAPGATNPNKGPRPRRGHSLVHIKTRYSSVYKGATYLIMFGGRDNDGTRLHIPKTYNVVKANGSLQFTTYDQKPVDPCNDIEGLYYSADQRSHCDFNTTSTVSVGVFYNDIWAYRMCNSSGGAARNQHRWADQSCVGEGWVLWDPGAREGGCSMKLGQTVCTTPSERYNHGVAMFADGCMYIYGGYSQRCQDYCDDLWFYDIYLRNWRQIYPAGALSKLYFETLSTGAIVPYNETDVPIVNSPSRFAGPGARWRHSMAVGLPYTVVNYTTKKVRKLQQVAIYGGHRLWQGFSAENSQSNSWNNYSRVPPGGYLEDLWIYTKELDYTTPLEHFYRTTDGFWKIMKTPEVCVPTPGIPWDTRDDQTCTTTTPGPRAGHGSVFDSYNNLIWIFGGYRTYYPYLSTDGEGSGPGTASVGSGGFVPYPGYDYYLNDLWYFNLTNNLWTLVDPVLSPSAPDIPAPRADHVFVLLGDKNVILMHGGYADNRIFDDFWYFNISTNIWLRKNEFVYPQYPGNCTDDWQYIHGNPACTQQNMTWPKHLKRQSVYPFDILPYSRQPYYWPDPENGPYYNIFKKGADMHARALKVGSGDYAPVGTPEFPYAATGPMQYARKFFYAFNSTHNGTLLEWCTSVFAEPTRANRLAGILNGLAGRANRSIFIPQPRRQRPGWDGCRDRQDRNPNLPQMLQYLNPDPTYGHRATFVDETNELIMYGGRSYLEEQVPLLNITYDMVTNDKMWYFNLFTCINNCSFHGDCYFGYCLCWPGYYGVDCSNTSCPGTSCYYDTINWQQHCFHGCQAGYNHTDEDVYVQDVTKTPCTKDNPGEENGVCNGYGTTYCAPPFVGDDCGTKDCKSNCSFNGWCAIEFPVSRCMCNPGYYGEICQYTVCLNNCTYPNGVCNTTSGECTCNMMYSPYNNTREFHPWDGEDCSYLHAYAGSSSIFQWMRSGGRYLSLIYTLAGIVLAGYGLDIVSSFWPLD